MISVEVATTGKTLSLRLTGHAGYAEVGKDIVCASASILAYTVARMVMEAEQRGDLKASAEVKIAGGDVYILCEPMEDALPGMQGVFSFAKTGYELLATNYPQYVRLMP